MECSELLLQQRAVVVLRLLDTCCKSGVGLDRISRSILDEIRHYEHESPVLVQERIRFRVRCLRRRVINDLVDSRNLSDVALPLLFRSQVVQPNDDNPILQRLDIDNAGKMNANARL